MQTQPVLPPGGEGAWFLLHENKGPMLLDIPFFSIQKKTKIMIFIDLSIFRYWELTLKMGHHWPMNNQ